MVGLVEVCKYSPNHPKVMEMARALDERLEIRCERPNCRNNFAVSLIQKTAAKRKDNDQDRKLAKDRVEVLFQLEVTERCGYLKGK